MAVADLGKGLLCGGQRGRKKWEVTLIDNVAIYVTGRKLEGPEDLPQYRLLEGLLSALRRTELTKRKVG
jgi:hypothetical protein